MNRIIVRSFSFLAFLFCSTSVFAGLMQVKIDGISLDTELYIDFIDGDGPSNAINISSLESDGSITLTELTGSAVSTPDGYDISDDQFLNGVAFSLTNATSVHFLVSFSNHSPSITGFSDALSVFLYADQFFNPSVITDDPLGSNSLLNWLATGVDNGELQVFNPLSTTSLSWSVIFIDTDVSVNEPNALILFMLALCPLFFFRKKSQEI